MDQTALSFCCLVKCHYNLQTTSFSGYFVSARHLKPDFCQTNRYIFLSKFLLCLILNTKYHKTHPIAKKCVVSTSRCEYQYLVIDEQLHRIVDSLQQYQLIGLTWHRVGERGPDAPFLGLEPYAGSEGIHFGDLFSHQAVHVAGSHGEGENEAIGERWLCHRFREDQNSQKVKKSIQ